MKTSILLNALQKAKLSLATDSLVPILSHFCFTSTQVYTFNDKTAVITDLQSGLDCGVKGAELLGVLGASAKEEISVSMAGGAEEGEVLVVQSGRMTARLPVLSKEDFVFTLPDITKSTSVDVDDDLLLGLQKCLTFMENDPLEPKTEGVTFKATAEGTFLYCTDNTTLTRIGVNTSCKPITVILPRSTVENMVVLGKLCSPVKVKAQIAGDVLTVTYQEGQEKTVLFSHIPEEEPHAFDKIIGTSLEEPHYSFKLTEEFLQAVRVAEMLQKNKDTKSAPEITLTLKQDGVKSWVDVSGEGDGGKVKGRAKVLEVYDTPKRPIKINPTKLLRLNKGSIVVVCSKCIMVDDEEENFLHLIASRNVEE